jgi:hypothetical protein
MVKENKYNLLIEKLDSFIRKFYKNELIKGSIYFFSIFLLFALLVSFIEYVGHFNTGIRTFLFYSFIFINAIVLTRFIVIPLFRLNKLGSFISHEQAAAIIGKHFSNVNDKILNTLQLYKTLSGETSIGVTNDLIIAGINQKIVEISPIPFTSAIDLSKNKKYLKYAIFPLFAFLGILFCLPAMITDSTARLIDHNSFYAKPAPFSFQILNNNLTATQQKDFLLRVKTSGSALPLDAYIEIDGNEFKLEKENKLHFNFTFKNLQHKVSFRLFSEGIYSKNYDLIVIPNPIVLNFDMQLQFPAYLHKQNEIVKNTGDLVIPEGTKVQWNFYTQNTDFLNIYFDSSPLQKLNSDKQVFSFSRQWFKSDRYLVTAFNKFIKNGDSILYNVNVIPDVFPNLSVEENKDSVANTQHFFKGTIKDDYGFTKLTFNYTIQHQDSSGNERKKQESKTVGIPLNKLSTQESFFYFWDVSTLALKSGDFLEYFFEVSDNDCIHGPKSAKSQRMLYKVPTSKELAEVINKNNDHIKSDLKESIREAKKLQKDLADFNKKLFEKKEAGWDDKKAANDLLNRQKNLVDKISAIQKENKNNNLEKSILQESTEEFKEKQQKLNELMEQLLTDDMKKMMQELQQMLEKTDNAALKEQMDKMKNATKDVEKELDRSLAIFKQLEFKQKLEDAISGLDKLGKKQDDLSKESDKKDADSKALEKKENEVNDAFKALEKELMQLEKTQDQLEFKEGFKNPEEDQKSIENDIQESEKSLSQGKSKAAAKKQKSAGDKMAKLSDKLKKMQEDSDQEQAEEDMDAMRAVLENLLRLSFGEEQLISDVKTIGINDPKYLKIAQQQRVLKEDAQLIEDSLINLSKRVVQIQSIINKEIGSINTNITSSLQSLEERQTEQARMRQQYVMTSVNNLALLLSEILESMQQQMAKSKPNQNKTPGGKSACKKPGSGSPSMSSIRKMQEQLNQQLKALKEGKQGSGGQKGGSTPSTEQIAKLAAQQAMIRNEINKMGSAYNNKGKGSLGNLNKISEQMEQTETDLVNKILNREVLTRQQEILGRLLESEKAEKEREQDSKRESNEAKEILNRNPPQYAEYKKQKMKEMELLKSVPPSFNPFYKKIVNDYFQRIVN